MRLSAHNFKDLSGKKIDYLTVQYFNKQTGKWVCKCDCGNTVEKKAGHLNLSNRVQSCGCMNKRKFIDITGQRFGRLTVKRYIKEKQLWECECDCGSIVEKQSGHLRSGLVKSCGCLDREKQEDLKGKKFGRLTAEQYLGGNIWLCRCDCGEYKKVLAVNLKRSNTISCDKCNEHKLIDITGKRFGMLTAIKYLQKGVWECRCDCGNITTVNGYDLRNNRVISCGCAKISKKENELIAFIQSIYKGEVIQSCRDVIQPYELDIYIPSHKLAIEFNGDYWHSDVYKDRYYHQNKTIACAKQGIQLIHIFEYEWDNVACQEKIKQYLMDKISNSAKRVFARKCEIREINSNIAYEFLNRYHLQGGCNSAVNIGAYIKDELIGVMTFGKPRFNHKYEWEIHRLCWKFGIKVVGGTERLFKYFLREYKPKSVITYVEISKFTGNVYSRLGFKPIKPNPITKPNYVWVNSDGVVLTRYQTQKKKLVKQGFGVWEQTEDEIMHNNKYYKLYNSGNLRLEYIENQM